MINGKSVLAVITARGGSKGIPGKNIRMVAGKPLIAWTIDAAKPSRYIDRLILSTDDEKIASVAAEFGCEVPFRRPQNLAQDDTPGIEPVLHAVEMLPHYDHVILLQPTSPLRTTEDIDACLELFEKRGAKACVSVVETDKPPFWMYQLEPDNKMKPVLENGERYHRRQDAPPVYVLNGAVYVAHAQWLRESKSFLTEETLAFVMPKERSLDVDTEADLLLAEYYLEKRIH